MIRIVSVVALCLIGIFLRLEMENRAMASPHVAQLLQSQQTYKTVLTVENDPDYSHFSAKVVATDEVLDRRVIATGSAETNGQLASLEVGDTVFVSGYLVELTPYQTYKRHEHIVANFHVEEIADMKRSHSKVDVLTSRFRNAIEKGCSRLETNERGVCEGLLIGERSNIDQSLYDTYKDAQLTHLLVASGANIAFLVGFLSPLISRLRVNTRSILLILIALFYCAATRFEPSMLRASVMVIIPAIAMMRGYCVSNVKIFIGTLFACLLIDPFLLYRVGFWLSLCATGGLYFLSPIINVVVRSTLISNTLAATLCVQPVLWMTFGFSAPLRWWASVVAVAIAEPLTTIGMVIVVVVSFVSPHASISQLLISLFQLGANALNIIARIGASQEGLYLGGVFSAAGLIAYTYRYWTLRRANREERVDVEKRVLHYR